MEKHHSRHHAVKFLDLPSSIDREKRIEAFSREFKTLSRLKHLCVVPVYGFSRAASGYTQAIVMKYMPNGSLGDVLRRVKKGKPPAFWTHTGIAIIVCGIVVGLEFISSSRSETGEHPH
jgi:serine/threonine protein kinase